MNNCLQAVEFVLSQRFEDQEPPFNCYDNAISTLGKLIFYKGHAMTDLGGTVTKFLERLPLSTDSTEA